MEKPVRVRVPPFFCPPAPPSRSDPPALDYPDLVYVVGIQG